jgi:hypothetical protein
MQSLPSPIKTNLADLQFVSFDVIGRAFRCRLTTEYPDVAASIQNALGNTHGVVSITAERPFTWAAFSDVYELTVAVNFARWPNHKQRMIGIMHDVARTGKAHIEKLVYQNKSRAQTGRKSTEGSGVKVAVAGVAPSGSVRGHETKGYVNPAAPRRGAKQN